MISNNAIAGAAFIVAALLVSLIWRLWSRRQSLPCPAWLGWMVELDNPLAKSNQARFIVSHLNLEKGMTVLDAGCGPGRVSLPLAKAVGPDGRVDAVDLQPQMLKRVDSKAKQARLGNISTLQAGLGEGKLEHGTYDRATMVAVLGEILDQPAALEELFSALKPGGQLAIAELIFDPHFQSREKVSRLAQTAGFEEIARYGNLLAYLLIFKRH